MNLEPQTLKYYEWSDINVEQHQLYKRFAHPLIKGNPNRKVTDVGQTPSLSGELFNTIMVEGKGYGCTNFKQLLNT